MNGFFRCYGLPAALVLFGGGLLPSWLTHSTGVVHDDPKRNISIPTQLTVLLQVQAAYNGTDMFFRYRWPADKPGIFHDMLKFEDGQLIAETRAGDGGKSAAASNWDGERKQPKLMFNAPALG
ncbi:MAG: hypothetical protein CVU24_01335 [Betaproteobacteria bacterium HGW-Betaproteobacteria-18]|nr:MAG: hypothetical protein CVU24_01335 [Betaproteobacteria bacterium HGW-Betaproteobacteria-18]